jgi:predicted permease
LLRPLPVEDPDRLVSLFTAYEEMDDYSHSSYPDYEDLRDRCDAFSGLAAHFYYPMGLRTSARAEVIAGQVVTWNYFSVLGVTPFLGRGFLPEEDQAPGSHAVAVLSYRIWERRFDSDPQILGKTVPINSHPFTVVGVAPKGFTGLTVFLKPDVWVPTMMVEQVGMFPVDVNSRSGGWLKLIGRLKPGVSLAEAQAAANVLAANLAQEYPDSNQTKSFPMVEADRNRVSLVGTTDAQERLFAVLMGVVGLVLLIACSNVANLQLARAMRRQKEIALRASLGASRWRVLRQLLTESALLSLFAGAAGLLIAVWAVDVILAFQATIVEFPVELDLGLDRRVLGFTVLVSLLSAVLFGLAPAMQMIRRGQTAALKDQASALSQGAGKSRLQNALVTAQVALSLVLLISAGLLLRSMENTLALDPGFDSRNGMALPINLGFGQYNRAEGMQFLERMIDRAESLPFVRSAAVAAELPLGQLHIRDSIEVDGYVPAPDEKMVVRLNLVGPNYFETLGIPILKGRGIDERDKEDRKPVAVINETMAERFWPGEDPIGKTIRSLGEAPVEVVGVVKDGKYDALDESPQPYFSLALDQAGVFLKQVNLIVKTDGDPRAVMAPLRREIEQLDPNMPVSHIMTLNEFLEIRVDETGGPADMVGVLGVLALLLAMVGVFGVMSYSVSQRTREIGIRIALGAQRSEILKLVLRKGVKITLIGVVIGLAGAVAATRVVSSFLYGVDPLDPVTFAGVSAALLAAALLACYLPAQWGTRVDPVGALRHE